MLVGRIEAEMRIFREKEKECFLPHRRSHLRREQAVPHRGRPWQRLQAVGVGLRVKGSAETQAGQADSDVGYE